MQPIAVGIDELQGDVDMYMGALIPTILYIINSLNNLDDDDLQYLAFLRDGLVSAIQYRFTDVLNDDKRKLASAYHPLYKTGWATPQQKADVRTLVIRDLESAFPRTLTSASSSLSSGDGKSIRPVAAGGLRRKIMSSFRSTNPANQGRACVAGLVSSVTLFLEDVPVNEEGDDHLVATWRAQLTDKHMRERFVRFNTTLPSSASVERLFSVGKDILRPKRCRLTDFNFEMVMFLRINMHLLNEEH